MFAFLLAQVLAVGLLSVLGVDVEIGDTLTAHAALVLVVVQAIGIAVALGLVAVLPTTWRRVGVRGWGAVSFDRGWRLLVPAGALVIGPTILGSFLARDPLVKDGLGVPTVASYVLLASAIAVNEELWFRGLVVDQLRLTLRPWFTVTTAAVLFGLPHVGSTAASWVNAAGVTLAVAIPFIVVRLVVGSIWPMVVWHALIDSWAFIHTATVVPEGSFDAADAAVALVLPVLIAGGYLLWFRRHAATALRP